jgi:hypothetical protein
MGMEQAAVFVIVALAGLYASWKLMPRALRARLAQAGVGWARRRGRLSGDEAAALTRRLTASGCGSCDSCGSCVTKPGAAPDTSVLRIVPTGSQPDRTAR